MSVKSLNRKCYGFVTDLFLVCLTGNTYLSRKYFVIIYPGWSRWYL